MSLVSTYRRRLLLVCLLALMPACGVAIYEAAYQPLRLPFLSGSPETPELDAVPARATQRLRAARELLSSLAHLPQVTEGDAGACETLLREVARRHPEHSLLALVGAEGGVACSGTATSPRLGEDGLWRRAQREGRFMLGRLATADTPGMLAAVLPVHASSGVPRGVLVASVRLVDEPAEASGASIELLEDMGGDQALVAANPPTSPSFAQFLGHGAVLAQGRDGTTRLLAMRRLEIEPGQTGPILALAAPVEPRWGARSVSSGLALPLCIAGLLMTGVWVAGQRLLVRPLDRLLVAAARVGNGDRKARTGLAHDDDEMGRLARAYDEMAESLERSDMQLRQTLASLGESLGFRLLVESVKDYAIFMTDAGGRVVSWNQGAERIKGYSASEILGRPFLGLCTPEDIAAGKPEHALRVALSEGRHEEQTWRLRKDGSRFWANVTTTAIRDPGGQLRGFSHVVRDLTERRQAEEGLRGLSQRLLVAQEEERRRIARELHDEIGQVLTSVKFSLQWLHRDPAAHSLRPRLDASVAQVDRAIGEVRELSLRLRPSILDELGLPAALRWYLAGVSRQDRFHLHVAVEAFDERLASEVEVACFRVAQEALTNITRHSKAANVSVTLERRADRLELSVRDDGVGFDVSQARERAASGECMGLSGMQERVSLAGGRVEMRSAPGSGTEVLASFPLTAPAGPEPARAPAAEAP